MEVDVRGAVLDGAAVRAWAAAALAACTAARERIDAVNVFPVPDGDTGSNVALTLAGGAQALAGAPDAGAEADAAGVAAAFAHGAARAARGSSGIILSQWLAGFAAGLAVGPAPDAVRLTTALAHAADAARAAVPDPQEGTVLTVARRVADDVRRRPTAPGPAPADLLDAAVARARGDLAAVSEGHDVLRAARVVDAGACALLVVLDALVRTLRGDDPAREDDLAWLPHAGDDALARCVPAAGGAFEVMMLVTRGPAAGPDDGADLADALRGVGDAVAVADAGGVRHVHVHTDDPAAAVELVPVPAREQVVVRRVDEPAPAARGLVVLTRSPGLAAWYATCGAVTLVGPVADPHRVARAAVDTRAERAVVVDAGVGGAQDVDDVDVLVAADDGAAVVACLALVADPGLDPRAGRAALARLVAVTRADPAADPADLLQDVADLLRDAPDAQAVTLVHGAGAAAAAADVAHRVLEAHPEVEVVVAGPAAGPAWWVGVD